MVDADVIGSAKIFNADCLKMLGGGVLPDNSISACIADPPYGVDFHSG